MVYISDIAIPFALHTKVCGKKNYVHRFQICDLTKPSEKLVAAHITVTFNTVHDSLAAFHTLFYNGPVDKPHTRQPFAPRPSGLKTTLKID